MRIKRNRSHFQCYERYGTCVTPPHLQAVVHAAGDDLGPLHVEVRAQHLVPVTSRMVLLR